MVALTNWNGTDEVGGVQLALDDGESTLVFDLGAVPGVLDRWQLPSPDRSLLEPLLAAGHAPDVAGLFHAAAGPAPTVFVSHLHPDHAALLPLVHPDVTVLASDDTARLLGVMVEVGELPPAGTALEGLADGTQRRLAGVTLDCVAVDHTIPGSAGFIARLDDVTVAWTGDWRWHGPDREVMARFAAACQRAHVDVLITDATATSPPVASPPWSHSVAEAEIDPRLREIAERSDGTVWFACDPTNLARWRRLQLAATASGRRLVVTPQTARRLAAARAVGLPAPLEDALTVLQTDGTAGPFPGEQMTPTELDEHRGELCVEVPPAHRAALDGLGPRPGDPYVHLDAAPMSPRSSDWPALEAWISRHQLTPTRLHSNGHATVDALARLAETSGASTIIPVHSDAPGDFPAGPYEVQVLQPRSTTRLRDGA